MVDELARIRWCVTHDYQHAGERYDNCDVVDAVVYRATSQTSEGKRLVADGVVWHQVEVDELVIE